MQYLNLTDNFWCVDEEIIHNEKLYNAALIAINALPKCDYSDVYLRYTRSTYSCYNLETKMISVGSDAVKTFADAVFLFSHELRHHHQSENNKFKFRVEKDCTYFIWGNDVFNMNIEYNEKDYFNFPWEEDANVTAAKIVNFCIDEPVLTKELENNYQDAMERIKLQPKEKQNVWK